MEGEMSFKIRLFFKLVGVSLKSQMQHRASFWMLFFSYFLSAFIDIIGMWALFDRFKMIEGWTFHEMALIYGVIHMGFSLAETFGRGFDAFDQVVKMGDFDRILLRPMGTLFQVAVQEIDFMRLGRFLQGFIVLILGLYSVTPSFAPYHLLIIPFSVLATACLFYGLHILQATLAFWTVETLELMNITTYGGLEAGQYPLKIYHPVIRLFFTYLIPLGCVGYIPLGALLQQENIPLWLGALSPFVGIVFLFIACQVWKLGVRHYHSTGS